MSWEQVSGKPSGDPELEDQAVLADIPLLPLMPATVGPCSTCRRIVKLALGERADLQVWFHLVPRAGLCFRHRGGSKGSP